MTTPTVEYDPEAKALYIRFSDKPYSHGEDLDRERRVDFAEDGTLIGVELLCVDSGVDLTDLPLAAEIAELLKRRSIRVLA